MCVFANFKYFFMLALRSNGFFTATLPCNPFSRSLRETVDLETCSFLGRLVFHSFIKSRAVLFLSLRLFKHRSFTALLQSFLGLPFLFPVSKSPVSLAQSRMHFTVFGELLMSVAIFLSVHPASLKAFILLLCEMDNSAFFGNIVDHINSPAGMLFGKT